MTTLTRIRVPWSGSAVVGGGLSTFYFVGPPAVAQPAVKDFFDACKGMFPSGVTWTVPTAGETIDDNTGSLDGVWSAGSGGSISGTNPGAYAAGVGARLVWETAGITGSRRVRGSTFLLPLVASQYEGDGSIHSGVVSTFTAAANALWTTATIDQVILTRLTPTHSGTSHQVTGVTVPDKVSWLRSRRT